MKLNINKLRIIKLLVTFNLSLISLYANNWSDEEIVNAIYKAEGGSKAVKPFGILSVHCAGYDDCRQVCPMQAYGHVSLPRNESPTLVRHGPLATEDSGQRPRPRPERIGHGWNVSLAASRINRAPGTSIARETPGRLARPGRCDRFLCVSAAGSRQWTQHSQVARRSG